MVLAPLGCVGASSESAEAIVPTVPFVVVLGSAQDGGLPQIGCRESLCEAARADLARRRFASSILLVDPHEAAMRLQVRVVGALHVVRFFKDELSV
jgi:hypothetical protein